MVPSPVSAIPAVVRSLLICSDIVLDCRSVISNASPFSEEYRHAHNFLSDTPSVITVPYGADPGTTILYHSSRSLISVTLVSDARVLSFFLPHLTEIVTLPVVINIAVQGNYKDALMLRSNAPYFLVSSNLQQTHDNTLLALRLARTERKLVVNVFEQESRAGALNELSLDSIRSFLVSEKRAPPRPHANGYINDNSHLTNGKDHINGVNGSNSLSEANGHSGESSPMSSEHLLLDDPAKSILFEAYESASLATLALVRRPVLPFVHHGDMKSETVIFLLGQWPTSAMKTDDVLYVNVSLLSPLLPSKLIRTISATAKRVVVLEQVHNWAMKWTPFFIELMSAFQHLGFDDRFVRSGNMGDLSNATSEDVTHLVEQASKCSFSTRLYFGSKLQAPPAAAVHVPIHEASYTKVLSQLFGEQLEVLNSPSLISTYGPLATSPEFALGRARAILNERAAFVRNAEKLLESSLDIPTELYDLLSKWLITKDDVIKGDELIDKFIPAIREHKNSHAGISSLASLALHLKSSSRWIIGSDAWSYDTGFSGLHHLITSGLNVNILIIDNLPFSRRNMVDPVRRKRDIGLYAMNHSDVYVASVAIYSSYGQVLQAFSEASSFNGPSVILAYLPYTSEDESALDILKETKLAVDSGYWPLYRWDPRKDKDGSEPFSLDSDIIKKELQEFLDRQNHLSQLTLSKPQFAMELVSGFGETVKEARRKRALQVYDSMISSMSGGSLLILYASDGGTAEKMAKRLASRGKARGLSTTVATLDSVTLESLQDEEHVAFITSVAGQGEPPQNGRSFFKSANAAVSRGEKPFSKLKFSVFGLGDSHYWPRPEDAQYYNKPSKDLNKRLEELGGERFADLGLGDDQDADGPETGYKLWEPAVWKALGVHTVEVLEAEPDPITNEHIKVASNYLRGTIVEGLEDNSTGAISPSDGQLTKFHGIYQQDDRDIRDERQAQGIEPAYAFMIRVRMPGGVCTPAQWLAINQIADEHGNSTFKITTRQTFQFHGVIKRHLKPSIQAINKALLDTLAACGDVNRNVICSASPTKSRLHKDVYEFAKGLSERLIPRTTAYHEIWLNKKMVAGDAIQDFEPLYGEFYLPRKYKIAVAVPPTNDVDVFANDVGFIAIVDEQGSLIGFNVTAGGGMGVTHANKKTYPRLGDLLGFCTVAQGHEAAEKIMLVQRDNGNRVDRKNARLKYTIDRMGLDNFKAEVERRLGWSFAPPRSYQFDRNIDDFGWSRGENGMHNFMMFIENGRIQDETGRNFKTALREIAKIHKGTFRLTANQHLMLSDVPEEELSAIKRLLVQYKLDNLDHSALRLSSSACVAFPTCGLAMAESERYLPILISKVETICEENGLRNDSIVMRMTGCPNGCARPYVAEVAFVGKAPGSYMMLLGGGYYGQRLNKIYRETVSEPEILAILKPMIKHYALERLEGERFGDFVIRAGYISATTSGKDWYEGMGGSGPHREVIA